VLLFINETAWESSRLVVREKILRMEIIGV